MLDASFIGDKLTGGGFALVGIRTPQVPETSDDLWRLILAERERRQLIMISAHCAARVADRLEQLIESRPVPPILVLADGDAELSTDSAIRKALTALGVESARTRER